MIFSGFGATPELAVALDARKIGSTARFARRSCHPNTRLKHVIRYGKLHVFLVAAEDIDFSIEITIPFDYDWQESTTELNCACGEDQCPIKQFNVSIAEKYPKKAEEVNGVGSPRRSLATPKSPKSQKPKSLVKTEGRGMPKAVSVNPSHKKKFKKGKSKNVVGFLMRGLVSKKMKSKGKINLKPLLKRSDSKSTRDGETLEKKAKIEEEKADEERADAPTTRSRNKSALEEE